MMISLRRRALAVAVFFVSLIVFGPLIYLLNVRTAEILAELAGVSTLLTGPLGLLVSLGAVIIALNAVWEIAAVRLHGVAILHRGSTTWRLGRHLLLTVAILAAFVSLTDLFVGMIRWGLARQSGMYVGGSLVLLAALLWAAIRSIRAFREGFRTTTTSPRELA